MEVVVLAGRVGSEFTGTVVEVDDNRRHGRLMLADPAVEATVTGTDLPLGQEIRVRVASADPVKGAVTFEAV
jgi:exoribonuclease R